MDEIQLTPEKSFQIKLSSDKNNSYSLEFNLNNYIEITANQINNIIHKSYSSKYSFEEIRQNKYFLQFDTLDEIFDEIKDRIYNNKIIIKENNNLILSVPLPTTKHKEIIFELKSSIKNNNERLNELTDLIIKLSSEMNNIKNENIFKTEENLNLKNEIKQLNTRLNKLENAEIQLKNENIQLKNDINELKNEVNTNLKDYKTQLNGENVLIKKEFTELNEKLNILWKERIKIEYSKIINGKDDYIKILKNWINPLKKIKAELLYRLSDNGKNITTFHKLCDNQGPTLTLFHITDGNKVGFIPHCLWDHQMDGKMIWKLLFLI